MTILKRVSSLLAIVFSALLLVSPLHAAEPDTVTVTGVVESVLLSKQKVKIRHDEVPEWGWKKMKMKFDVAAGVDLGALAEGQAVSFTLQKQDGKPVITAIQ